MLFPVKGIFRRLCPLHRLRLHRFLKQFMVTINIHHPNFFAMLTLLANFRSLPVASLLALVSLNLLQSPTCQDLHLMSMLVLSFVLFNASQHKIPLRSVNVRESRLWIGSQQGKPQSNAVLAKLMSDLLNNHSSVYIMHYSDGRNISAMLTPVGF